MSKLISMKYAAYVLAFSLLAIQPANAVNINDDSFQFGTKSEVPADMNHEQQAVDMPTPSQENSPNLVFGAGHENNDSAVNDRVKAAVMADKTLSAQLNKFDSETKDGVVTVTGSVTSDSVKATLMEKIKAVSGVHTVVDKIDVSK